MRPRKVALAILLLILALSLSAKFSSSTGTADDFLLSSDINDFSKSGNPCLSISDLGLLVVVRRSEEKPEIPFPKMLFNTLQTQDGLTERSETCWTFSCYTNDYFTTGEADRAIIKHPGNEFESVFDADWHIIFGQFRKVCNTDTRNQVGLKPLLFKTGEGSGRRTFSFAHNGAVSNTRLNQMSDFIKNLIENEGWNSNTWSQYLWDDQDETLVDSKTFFGYLMAQIRLNGWDILRGLREALTTISFDAGSSAWNFVFTDGYESYSYANRRNIITHPLAYTIRKCRQGREYAVVMSQLPSTFNDTYSFNNDELVYIPTSGQPQHFKNFSQEKLRWVKKPLKIAGGNSYLTWDSFPVLDFDLTTPDAAVNTMEQGYAGGTGVKLSHAWKVIDYPDMYIHTTYDVPGGNWQLPQTDYIDEFNPYHGYKTAHVGYADSDKMEIAGTICEGDTTTIRLQPGSNWVGYWLLNDQSLRDALGDYLDNGISAVGDVGAYYDKYYNLISPLPSGYDPLERAMEFGTMYEIWVDGVNSVRFRWENSRKPYIPHPRNHLSYPEERLLPEYFTFEQQSEYQVIQIDEIDDLLNAYEIGIFAGNDCIGAAVINDFPMQILIYPEGYENTDLVFRFYDGIYDYASTLTTEIWCDKVEDWYTAGSGDLVAGTPKFSLVKLTGSQVPPRYFTYSQTSDQQTIIIESMDDNHNVYEVGVFAGSTCIGASQITGFPITITAYPEGYEDMDLTFTFWDGDVEYTSSNTVEIWDDLLYQWNEVMPGDFIAGDGLFDTVRLVENYKSAKLDGNSASPNPFNPDVTISFSLQGSSQVEAVVYNIRGQKVATIAKGDYTPGTYHLVWQGKNDNNQPVGSGVYFYRITAGKETLTGKMLMLK